MRSQRPTAGMHLEAKNDELSAADFATNDVAWIEKIGHTALSAKRNCRSIGLVHESLTNGDTLT